jgi:hypothetical protein
MQQQPISLKIGSNMFTEQMKWTVWFIGISFLVHIIQICGNLLGTRSDNNEVTDYFLASHIAGNIYMLVIGIIAAYAFLPFFVQNGLTRRDVFKGSLLAAIGLSIVIPIITLILSLLVGWIVDLFNLPVTITDMPVFDKEDTSGNLIEAIVFSILDAPTGVHENLSLALLLNTLNLFFFYIVGYFITTGFYRFNVMIGLGYILISISLISIRSMFWGTNTMDIVYNWLPIGTFQLSSSAFIVASIVLSLIIIWLIRLTTKKMAIKL